MKEEEVRQLENYYNCLIEQKNIAAKLTEEANDVEDFTKVDPLAEFDRIQLDKYLVEKAGLKPKKAILNVGKKKTKYEIVMKEWKKKG